MLLPFRSRARIFIPRNEMKLVTEIDMGVTSEGLKNMNYAQMCLPSWGAERRHLAKVEKILARKQSCSCSYCSEDMDAPPLFRDTYLMKETIMAVLFTEECDGWEA